MTGGNKIGAAIDMYNSVRWIPDRNSGSHLECGKQPLPQGDGKGIHQDDDLFSVTDSGAVIQAARCIPLSVGDGAGLRFRPILTTRSGRKVAEWVVTVQGPGVTIIHQLVPGVSSIERWLPASWPLAGHGGAYRKKRSILIPIRVFPPLGGHSGRLVRALARANYLLSGGVSR